MIFETSGTSSQDLSYEGDHDSHKGHFDHFRKKGRQRSCSGWRQLALNTADPTAPIWTTDSNGEEYARKDSAED
jgi:hypothetical protein